MLTMASYLADNARPVHERIAAFIGRQLGRPAELVKESSSCLPRYRTP